MSLLEQLTVGEIESFPPNANVFKEDSYHMGQRFGKGWWLMFDHSDKSVFKYVILVHEPTGRRFKLQVPESLQKMPDPECEKCNGDGYIVDDVEVCPESGSTVGSCVECDCKQGDAS